MNSVFIEEARSSRDLVGVVWGYSVSSKDPVCKYLGEDVYSFLFEVRYGSLSPLLVQKCNIAEGWIEFIMPADEDGWKLILDGKLCDVFKDEDDKVVYSRVENIKSGLEVDVLDKRGDLLVTMCRVVRDGVSEIQFHCYVGENDE